MSYCPPPPGYPPPGQPHPYGPPPKKSRAGLWIALSVVGVLLLCGGGFFFIYEMTLSPDSGLQKIKQLTIDAKQAVDDKDTTKLQGMLCSADVPHAAEAAKDDSIAPGQINVVGMSVINNVGAVSF